MNRKRKSKKNSRRKFTHHVATGLAKDKNPIVEGEILEVTKKALTKR